MWNCSPLSDGNICKELWLLLQFTTNGLWNGNGNGIYYAIMINGTWNVCKSIEGKKIPAELFELCAIAMDQHNLYG